MDRIIVGELYSPGVTSYPIDVEYKFELGLHSIVMYCSGITNGDVVAVSSGEPKFALIPICPEILLLAFRVGDRGWSFASLCWYRTAPDDRVPPPELKPGKRAPVTIVLVDADTGIVRAMNVVRFSHRFTRSLYEAINRQIESPPLPDAKYDRLAKAVQAKYPTVESMLVDATAIQHGSGAEVMVTRPGVLVAGRVQKRFGTRDVAYIEPVPRSRDAIYYIFAKSGIRLVGENDWKNGQIIVVSDLSEDRPSALAALIVRVLDRPADVWLELLPIFAWAPLTGDIVSHGQIPVPEDVIQIRSEIIEANPFFQRFQK